MPPGEGQCVRASSRRLRRRGVLGLRAEGLGRLSGQELAEETAERGIAGVGEEFFDLVSGRPRGPGGVHGAEEQGRMVVPRIVHRGLRGGDQDGREGPVCLSPVLM